MVQQLGLAAGFETADAEAARLDKLEALLRQGAEDVGEAAPLVAALLGIDAGGRYPAPDLTPQQRRARTLAVLVEQLAGLARRRPVLMVLEDAHWIDPTTLELVGQALDRIAGARVLMLLTSRPDNQPAPGRAPARDAAHAQPARPRPDRGDRRRAWPAAGACRRRCWARSRPGPTGCRCSSRS